MAGQDLKKLGNLQIRMRPRKTGIYVAERSFPKGATPAHLDNYTKEFTDAAHACSSEVSSDVKGNDRVKALNACIAGKLG